jgi:hypothetical protein
MFEQLREQVESAGRLARGARRRHDRLREGHPEGRAARRRGARRDRGAHRVGGVKYYKDPHVIVDVGGQDIKLIVLNEGRVKDFKLNTQCSAGNGYFLQSTAEMFGVPVEGVRRQGVLGQGDAGLRLRLRRVHAVRHRQLPAPGLGARGDPRGPGGRAAEEHLPVRGEHPEPGEARVEVRAAGRHAAQPGGGEGGGRLHPLELPRARASSRRSSSTSTAASRARSARPSRRCACGRTATRRSSSASTPSSGSPTGRRATRRPAATSARTTACGRSSTSR